MPANKVNIRANHIARRWSQSLPMLLLAYKEGGAIAQGNAVEELMRMAELADRYVALSKQGIRKAAD